MDKINTKSDNVILYLRVSTDEQAKGFSLDYQEESLKRFCQLRGYNILAIYREDHSAKNFKRPEWSNLQSFVKSNKRTVDKVLFAKWDRFSRNVHEAFNIISQFENMGVEVNAAEQWLEPENPDKIILLSFYLSIGEAERRKIASRTKDGTYEAKTQGYYASRAPFGYDSHRDGHKTQRGVNKGKRSILIPNNNAHFVIRAFREVAMDIESIETTRKRLYNDGMILGKSAFTEMLKNLVYAGKIVVPEYKKESAKIVNAVHEPLIDMATFKKVQEIFSGKRWHGLKPSHTNLEFPLRDFLTCELCGNQITGSSSKGRSKKYAYYHCRNKCKTRVSAEETHIKISDLLIDLQINENVKELFAEVLKDSESQINGNKSNQLKTMLERQRNLKSRLENAENMLLDHEVTPETFNNMTSRINKELMTVNDEIESLNTSNDSIKQYVDAGIELLANLDILFMESDYEGKRILAGSLFTGKLIFGNDGCRTTNVNEVINVLTRSSKGLEGIKKGQTVKNYSLTVKVPGAGVEPARFPTGV
ncbi:recombinase family protein [Flavobacterium sp. LS2P90]|uniref:Recombinase family protein n=1 Tax=Flavobacterium xylosi TaxID=3230415 RepID=A0ABW6HTQ3_9FLAO